MNAKLIEAAQERIIRLSAVVTDNAREQKELTSEIRGLKALIRKLEKGIVPKTGLITVLYSSIGLVDQEQDDVERVVLMAWIVWNIVAMQQAKARSLFCNCWSVDG